MRAILIDPEKRTVTEIDIGKGFRETNAVLRCDSHTTGAAARLVVEMSAPIVDGTDE
jgi:hypothetical protein